MRADGVTPARVLRHLLGYWSAQIVAVAMRLDLFSELNGSTVKSIAQRRDWPNIHLLNALLECLIELELVLSDNNEFAPSPVAERYLVASSATDLRDIQSVFIGSDAPLVGRIENALRGSYDAGSRLCDLDISIGMEALSVPVADRVANIISRHAPATTSVLDLGGGSGIYSRRLATHLPDATFTQIDNADANEEAMRRARQDGIGDAFDTIEGSVVELLESLPTSDVIICCHLLHYFGADLSRDVLTACRASAKRAVIVADFTPLDGQAVGLFRRLFDVFIGAESPDAKILPLPTLLQCAGSAGFAKPDVVSMDPQPTNIFVWAVADSDGK